MQAERKVAARLLAVPVQQLVHPFQVFGHMRVPTVMAPHAEHTAARPFAPLRPIVQRVVQGCRDCASVQRVDQDAVVTVRHNILRAAVFGGDDGQTACRRLDQRQPERLGQGRVDENAAPPCRQAVQVRHIVGGMMLGQRDLAPQVVTVYGKQQVGKHLLLRFLQFADVVAIARHDDQIGGALQVGILPVSGDQALQVLARIRPAQCQYHGLVGLGQEFVYHVLDVAVQYLAARRREARGVRPGRNYRAEFRVVVLVQAVLLADFLPGAGHDHGGMAQQRFLGSDAPREVELPFDGRLFPAARQQPLLF